MKDTLHIKNPRFEIKDIYDLRNAYFRTHPNGHWFDRDTLAFFGESLSTMRLLKGTYRVKDFTGEEHSCYKVSKLSRKYPGGPKRTYAYFDVNTLNDIPV